MRPVDDSHRTRSELAQLEAWLQREPACALLEDGAAAARELQRLTALLGDERVSHEARLEPFRVLRSNRTRLHAEEPGALGELAYACAAQLARDTRKRCAPAGRSLLDACGYRSALGAGELSDADDQLFGDWLTTLCLHVLLDREGSESVKGAWVRASGAYLPTLVALLATRAGRAPAHATRELLCGALALSSTSEAPVLAERLSMAEWRLVFEAVIFGRPDPTRPLSELSARRARAQSALIEQLQAVAV